VSFSVEVAGLDKLDLGLTRVTSWLADLTPVWGSVKAQLEEMMADEFDSQDWEPLAESTVARKGFDTILVDSGAMMDSLVGDTGDTIYRPEPTRMTWGTARLAGYHQRGHDTPTPLPKRELFQREHLALYVGKGLHFAAYEMGALFK